MFWSRLFRPFEYTLSGILVSDVGRKRTENQDNFSFGEVINKNKLRSIRLETQKFNLPQAFGIMDGMGGEKLGAQASLETASFFSNIKKEYFSPFCLLGIFFLHRVFVNVQEFV